MYGHYMAILGYSVYDSKTQILYHDFKISTCCVFDCISITLTVLLYEITQKYNHISISQVRPDLINLVSVNL